MSAGRGFLGIWSDIGAADETDYLHWLTREHTEERVSVPGFLGVRVFRARLPGVRRVFILYRLDDAAVVGSPAYLARLNAPTAWSSRTMPKIMNFERGGGTVLAEHGSGCGGIMTARKLAAAEVAGVAASLPAIAAADRRVAARLLQVDRARTDIPTTEKAMRTGDQGFAAILMVEALDDAALAGVVSGDALVYDQIFSLPG